MKKATYPASVRVENMNDLIALAKTAKYRGYKSDPTELNNLSASRAAFALVAYMDVVGRDTIEISVAELIADLMHLCDASVGDNVDDIDPDDVVDIARMNYHHDLTGES